MAFIESNMLPLGTEAPAFELIDTVSGEVKSLESLRGDKATVVMFICNHCPYVIHVNPELKRLSTDFQSKGVQFIAISSNDVEKYPADAPSKMTEFVAENKFDFPYLYDESQEVAKAYDAACTPDFYIFDKSLKLAYRGRLDESTPGNGKSLDGSDLREALALVVSGEPVPEPHFPSGGCSIKWKA